MYYVLPLYTYAMQGAMDLLVGAIHFKLRIEYPDLYFGLYQPSFSNFSPF